MKTFLEIIELIAYLLTGIILLVFICLLVYRAYLKNITKIKTPNGVSSLEEIMLGNLRQWIFIRGTDKKNPVLIFLHGGPGSPLGGISGTRKYDKELINHFTIVHWDQRGAGKSYNAKIPLNKMTYDRFVEDCRELIDYILNKFNKQKVFLVGHSGGSVTGLKVAHKYPGKIYAYVGLGQIIDDYEKEKTGYYYMLDENMKSGNVKNQKAIRKLGPPPYDVPQKRFKKAKYIVQNGGFIHENPILKLISAQLTFITSPEYTILEGFRTYLNTGLNFTMGAMWEEIKSIKLIEEIKYIDVPLYFIHGKYDMIAPIYPVEMFYNTIDTKKKKKLIVLENSAHVPFIEEREKYREILIEVVLKESQNK